MTDEGCSCYRRGYCCLLDMTMLVCVGLKTCHVQMSRLMSLLQRKEQPSSLVHQKQKPPQNSLFIIHPIFPLQSSRSSHQYPQITHSRAYQNGYRRSSHTISTYTKTSAQSTAPRNIPRSSDRKTHVRLSRHAPRFKLPQSAAGGPTVARLLGEAFSTRDGVQGR
jgi:hypothetical protein